MPDDFERQRRAQHQRVAVRAAVLAAQHGAQARRIVRGIAAAQLGRVTASSP